MLENQYKSFVPLLLLCVMYLSAVIIADIMTYNLASLFGFVVSTSLFIFPLTYAVADIVTESYGRRIALALIISCLFGEFLVDVTLSLTTHAVSSLNSHQFSTAYVHLLQPLWHVFYGDFIGILVSSIINVLLMVKLKQYARFKHFIPRSICSTFLGEITFTIIAYVIWFAGKVSFAEVFGMIAMSMVFKIVFAMIMSLPAYSISLYIKRISAIPYARSR